MCGRRSRRTCRKAGSGERGRKLREGKLEVELRVGKKLRMGWGRNEAAITHLSASEVAAS